MVVRHERKYRIEETSPEAVKAVLASHVLSFRTLFPDRLVNSLYLDTADLQCYVDTLHGVKDRAKFRIRWYGDIEDRIEKPVLEVKCKDGELGWKHLRKMEPLTFGADLPTQIFKQLSKMALAVDTPGYQSSFTALPEMRPTLLVSYRRSYLASYDHVYRLTVDWDLQFRAVEGRIKPGLPQRDHAVIVEIKYPLNKDSEFDRVSQTLPFRIGKNSKYVTGMLLVGHV